MKIWLDNMKLEEPKKEEEQSNLANNLNFSILKKKIHPTLSRLKKNKKMKTP